MSLPARPRMRDLARALGVSQATISNAFHRPDQLSEELRQRILTAARNAGYAGPDPLANTFRKGRTGAVGLIVHKPLQYLFEDQAAQLTMSGVARACGEHGSSLVLVPRAEPTHPDIVSSALVDGFVAFCDPLEPARRELIRSRRLPVVGLDAPITAGKPFVGIDDSSAARTAATHIAALGHRRIGVICFRLSPDRPPGPVEEGLTVATAYAANRARLQGYRDGLAPVLAAGAQVTVVAADGVSEQDGASAAGALLDRADRPTALLVMGDRLALGAIAQARSMGIDVPRQLSVVGFDDVPAAAAATPALTTISQPHVDKGACAIHLLLSSEPAPVSRLLPTRLVVRASTAPPSQQRG
ncbi:substrate-binding domain-containing protein [Solwaraspora sp. WMMB335]|uniref:LacI family DNA-binding transcriptional regulator n=1 Tax=Solwaraspora sp. WMMB335 TaxID=3404118 RepID=UPI003B94F35D